MKKHESRAWRSMISRSKKCVMLCGLFGLLATTTSTYATTASSENGGTSHLQNNADQQKVLKGKVTDESGEPLPGVTIMIKGTSQGTVTDVDGNYSLKNVNDQQTVLFSFVGMKPQEMVIGQRAVIDIQLAPDALGLDEVVAIGYGVRKKSDLTGAVSSVSDDYLKEQPVSNVTQALQGSASGIQVTRPASPGADAEIRIRGMGTINNNQPLWVVDGVVGASSPAPNQIESIEILKDASSTAIYGARGASGVILVTTKSGKRNRPAQVELSFRTGISSPTANFDIMTDPTELGEMLWLEMQNDGQDPTYAHFGSGDKPVLNDYLFPNGGKIGDAAVDLANYDQLNNPITRSATNGTNWMDEVYQNGVIQDYDLTVSGGSEKTTYAFAASYLDEEGILKQTSYQRLALRSNIDSKVNNWLTLGQKLGVTYGQNNGYRSNNYRENLINHVYMANPLCPVYDIAGNYAGSVIGSTGDWHNPVSWLDRESDDEYKNYNITGNIYAQIEPVKGLTFKTLLGADVRMFNNFDPDYPELEFSKKTTTTTLNESNGSNLLWNWTNTMNFQKEIGAHSFDFLLGVEATKNVYRRMNASRQDYFSTDIEFLVLDAGASNQLNGGTGYAWTLFSMFGRAHYAYNDKYLFDVTVRRDGSSRFGEENKYGIFPAFAAGWAISEEAFMENTKGWLDHLKLRASWGQSGNDRIGNYNSYSTYGSGMGNSYYAIDGSDNNITVGYQSTAIGNPGAKWETTTSSNFAVDASLFGQVDVSVDLWQKETEDMLFPVAIPLVAGNATAPSVNIGTMKNTGIDLNIGLRGNITRDLKYTLNATASHYKNEVVKLSGNEDEYIAGSDLRSQIYTRTQQGRAFPEYFGYIVDGIFQTQAEADAHATNGTYNQPGNLKVRDVAGAFDANGKAIPDGIINADDRTYIGSPHPDLIAGLRLGLEYKNFDISTSLYASIGNDLVNYTARYIKYGLFDGPNTPDRLYKSWGSPYLKDNKDATLPKASVTQRFDQEASTIYIEDGSFLRMQNLQIGYNIPESITERMNIKKLRLYAMGTNLFTITNYTGLDPEVIPGNGNEINMGVDLGTWPITKQFIFGLDITF